MPLPFLTQAQAPLTRTVETVNEFGERQAIEIPAERPLTLYVDKHELVTLMTLGAHPEWLVLGYLRNQRFVDSVDAIESVTVDWDVGAAAVRTRQGIDSLEERTSRRVVTTGCGQGSVFGGLMDEIGQVRLPGDARMTQAGLYAILNAIRLQESTYKSAGSVHGCALFEGEELALFVEDVGRHNAVDTIAGWLMLREADAQLTPPPGRPKAGWAPSGGSDPHAVGERGGAVFYTTGRLTSEMVIKAAQMGIAIVVSRSGITQMGYEIAQQLGLCTIGRATNRHFLCYTGHDRFVPDPALARRAVTA